MKVCSKCGDEKPVAEFSRRASVKDGLQYRCKGCALVSNAAWQVANPKKVAANNAAWYAGNPEKSAASNAAWSAVNPEKVLAKRHRRRARQLNAPGTHTAADLQLLLALHENICPDCDGPLTTLHWHHVALLSRAGGDGPENLIPLCIPCHHARHSALPPGVVNTAICVPGRHVSTV